MRKDLDKDWLFPPSRLDATPPKRPKCLLPFVLVVLFIAVLLYLN